MIAALGEVVSHQRRIIRSRRLWIAAAAAIGVGASRRAVPERRHVAHEETPLRMPGAFGVTVMTVRLPVGGIRRAAVLTIDVFAAG